ncbi:MAG: hypothetical protein ACR2QA_00020 [Solirubrobacteraceae bacterium]
MPALSGTWSRASIGLEHPARPDQRRPITFDHELARGRTDVVLAHLGHPLVRMALALLRAEVWGAGHHLHRVTLRYAQASLGAPVAVAHGRLVIAGGSGHRLHEQLIFAGLRLGGEGRGRFGTDRPERLGVEATQAALALARDTAVPATLRDQLIPTLQASAEPLRAALQARASDRARQLTATLAGRAREEQAHVEATLSELAATIRREALGEHGDQLALITGLELDAGDRSQVERDVRSLRARLDAIPDEIAAQQAAIARRYADPAHRLSPAAVTLLVPEGMRL